MVGSVIPDTLIAYQIITLMLMVGFVPSMSIVTSLRGRDQTSCQILQISFVPLASLKQRSVLVTSFLMDGSAPKSLTGVGESTQGLTNTLSTAMLVLRKKLTMMGLFIKYLC